jgi:hypothetical protein
VGGEDTAAVDVNVGIGSGTGGSGNGSGNGGGSGGNASNGGGSGGGDGVGSGDGNGSVGGQAGNDGSTGLDREDAVAALDNMDAADVAALKQNCKGIMANPDAHSASAVAICQVAAAAR